MTMSDLVAGDLASDGMLAARPGDTWLGDRSWSRPSWTVAELEAAKAGRTISVVLPALDEEDTIESVIDSISPLVDGLVDELIVLDSGSTDDTEIRAVAAGARVVSREQALPEVPIRPGKGEALWRSLAATRGDIVVFVDSDLINPHPMFVPWLVGPCSPAHPPAAFTWSRAFTGGPSTSPTWAAARARPAAGGSPSWWPGRCSRRCAPSWAQCCSRWVANTQPPANC